MYTHYTFSKFASLISKMWRSSLRETGRDTRPNLAGEKKKGGQSMAYAIIRTSKIKSFAQIRKIEAHQQRKQFTPNADTTKPVLTLLRASKCDLEAFLKEGILKNVPIRKNAVIAQEILCSASPSYFRTPESDYGRYDEGKMEKWCSATLDYLKRAYGQNLVAVTLHLDEATPHIHAIVVPLDARGRLNARELFNPEACKRMQTEYAQALAPLGIQRGLEGSKAKHQEVRHWYTKQRAENAQSSNFFGQFRAKTR